MHPRQLNRASRQWIWDHELQGLTGEEDRKLFVEGGMSVREIFAIGQEKAQLASAELVAEYRREHPEEYERQQRRRLERRAARRRARGDTRPVIDISGMYTPAHIAKHTGRTPLEVRKFLRLKDIGKRGGRYAFKKAEAVKISRAVKKYYTQGKDR